MDGDVGYCDTGQDGQPAARKKKKKKKKKVVQEVDDADEE